MDQPTKIKIGPKQHLGDIEWQKMSNRLRTLVTVGTEEKYKTEYIDYIAWENQLRKTSSTVTKIIFKYCKISMLNLDRTKPSSPTIQEIHFNKCEFEKNTYITGCPKLMKIYFNDCKGTLILKNLAFRELIFAQDADAFCADISTTKVNAIFIAGIELNGQERYQLHRLQRQYTWEQYQDHILNSMMLSERTDSILQSSTQNSQQKPKLNSNQKQMSTLSLISLMQEEKAKPTLKQVQSQTIKSWDNEVTERTRNELLRRAKYKKFDIDDLYKSLHSTEGIGSYIAHFIENQWHPEVSIH